MTFDYSPLQATAAGLVARFGRSVTLRAVANTYNPITGTNVAANTDSAAIAVVVGVTSDYAEQVNAAGGNVLSGDRLAIISGAVVPTLGGFILDGGETWSIVRVDEVQPGPTLLLYKCQLRK